MTVRRYAHGLLAALLALTFFVTQERSPAKAQDPLPPYLTNWEVLDEYGSLRIRPENFFGAYPSQSQMVFVAPGIRRVKIKPHWEGSGISVAVATWDMSRRTTLSTDTITTSGTASSFLRIAPGGGTKLNISVTKGSQTTVYSSKYLVRESSGANADNYLNSMGVSPNPNARTGFRGERFPGQFMSFTPAGGDQQTKGSVTLTPPFSPEASSFLRIAPGGGSKLKIPITRGSQTTVYNKMSLVREWSAAMGISRAAKGISPNPNARESFRGERSPGQFESFTQAGGDQQARESITLTPTFSPYVQQYTATVPYAVSSVIVTPAASHSNATATVNGNSPSTPVSLTVGENVITVVVTAESGVQRTYTLTVTRASLPTPTPTPTPTATPTPTPTPTPTQEPAAQQLVELPTPIPTPTQEPEAQTVVEIPGPVVGVLLSATADSVTVSWQPPESGGAPNRYIVNLKPKGGGKGSTKRPKAKKTSVTFRNLKSGKTYKIWVRAQNKAGKGERVHASITLPSPQQEVQQLEERKPESALEVQAQELRPTATPTPTSQAQELTVPALTAQAAAGAVELRWEAVAGAVRYELMVWWDGLADWQPLGGDNLTGTTYPHTDVSAGTTYYYILSAVNAAGEMSDWQQEPYPSATVPD